MSFRILGTGAAAPKRVVQNHELSQWVDTTDEWITTRTGIKRRHIATDETMLDLAAQASKQALENAGISALELDYIICATMIGDSITPSLACLVQKELGATCPAFDVNAACSGFIYALDVAAGYFARKRAKHVLVIGIDFVSRLNDWTDRSTCVLFADGGGAVVLGEGDSLLGIRLTAKGTSDPLYIPAVDGNCPLTQVKRGNSYLQMDGAEVFKFAVHTLISGLKKLIKEAHLTWEDIDWVLPHQANMRIIQAAIDKLPIPAEKYINTLEEYGNTSAGTIPLSLHDANMKGMLKRGQILLMVAFGGGLTSGTCAIRW